MNADSHAENSESNSSDEAGGDSRTLPSYEQLRPRMVWEVFGLLSSIPRPSYKEEAVVDALQERCEVHGWLTQKDAGGNLIVSVPATEGMEETPSIILQGHVDLVAIKTDDSGHDFENDPISLIVDQDGDGVIVRADRTTLGADNGIGVAMALAAAEDPDVKHGPLELLFTVNEESGMTGAEDLKAEDLESRFLLNLDTEEDHVVYNGCVGGMSFEALWDIEKNSVPISENAWRIEVSGLMGGHSGLEINDKRGNAIKILCEVLEYVLTLGEVQVTEIDSGTFSNAIPAKSHAEIRFGNIDEKAWSDREGVIQSIINDAKNQIGNHASDLKITIGKSDHEFSGTILPAEQFVKCIKELPTGVLAMMDNDEDLESSVNIAIVRTLESKLMLKCSIRSLIKSKLFEYANQFEDIAGGHGAEVESNFSYPPWEPRADSRLLTLTSGVHEKLFGKQAKIGLIHGGLECGILSSKMPDTEMVSIGPWIKGAHTPQERVYVESVEKNYGFLKAILESAAELNQ